METVELLLTDEEFCALAKEAHRLDITFNQYIEKILREAMKEYIGVSTSPA